MNWLRQHRTTLFWLAVFVLLPSTAQVQIRGNRPLVLLYLLLGTIVVLAIAYASQQWPQRIGQPRLGTAGIVLLYLGLIIAFAVVYPRVNSSDPGSGSDRDDALNLAASELVAGRYPYTEKTYLDNPITPLPGAVLLAVPFVVLLGNSAWQTLLWLILFVSLSIKWLRNRQAQFLLAFLLLFVSPAGLVEWLTGGDLLANALYVLVLGVITLHQWTLDKESHTPISMVLVAILFGISLSSRANFLLVAPLIFASILHRRSLQAAVVCALITLSTTLLITLPFYAFDPAGFSPLHTASEIGVLDGAIPYLGSLVVPVAMVVLTLVFCLPRFCKNELDLLHSAAIIQLLPLVVGAITISGYIGRIDFRFFNFGLICLPFGLLAAWGKLHADS